MTDRADKIERADTMPFLTLSTRRRGTGNIRWMDDEGSGAEPENEWLLHRSLRTAVERVERLLGDARASFASGEAQVEATAVAEVCLLVLDDLEDVRFRLVVLGEADDSDGADGAS